MALALMGEIRAVLLRTALRSNLFLSASYSPKIRGDGEPPFGRSDGSIREAGGSFAEMQIAHEEEYCRNSKMSAVVSYFNMAIIFLFLRGQL